MGRDFADFAVGDHVLGASVLDRKAHGRVAAGESADEKFFGPVALVAGLPDGVTFDELDGFDAGFAAFAAFEHALHGFESVVVHGVGAAAADHEGVGDFAVERKFEFGGDAR